MYAFFTAMFVNNINVNKTWLSSNFDFMDILAYVSLFMNLLLFQLLIGPLISGRF